MHPTCRCLAKSTYEAVRLIRETPAGGRLGTLGTSPQLWRGTLIRADLADQVVDTSGNFGTVIAVT